MAPKSSEFSGLVNNLINTPEYQSLTNEERKIFKEKTRDVYAELSRREGLVNVTPSGVEPGPLARSIPDAAPQPERPIFGPSIDGTTMVRKQPAQSASFRLGPKVDQPGLPQMGAAVFNSFARIPGQLVSLIPGVAGPIAGAVIPDALGGKEIGTGLTQFSQAIDQTYEEMFPRQGPGWPGTLEDFGKMSAGDVAVNVADFLPEQIGTMLVPTIAAAKAGKVAQQFPRAAKILEVLARGPLKGVGAPAVGAFMGAAGQEVSEIGKGQVDKYGELHSPWAALGSGGVAGLFESLVPARIGKLWAEGGEEAAKAAVRNGLKASAKYFGKELTRNVLEEAATEMSQTFAETVGKDWGNNQEAFSQFLASRDKHGFLGAIMKSPLAAEAFISGAMGGLAGGAFGGGSVAADMRNIAREERGNPPVTTDRPPDVPPFSPAPSTVPGPVPVTTQPTQIGPEMFSQILNEFQKAGAIPDPNQRATVITNLFNTWDQLSKAPNLSPEAKKFVDSVKMPRFPRTILPTETQLNETLARGMDANRQGSLAKLAGIIAKMGQAKEVQNDRQNQQGLPGPVGGGQELVQGRPDLRGGAEATPSGGNVQTPQNQPQGQLTPPVERVKTESLGDLLNEAQSDGKVSVANVQRKLKRGYNASSQLIQDMLNGGLIVPSNKVGVFNVVAKTAQPPAPLPVPTPPPSAPVPPPQTPPISPAVPPAPPPVPVQIPPEPLKPEPVREPVRPERTFLDKVDEEYRDNPGEIERHLILGASGIIAQKGGFGTVRTIGSGLKIDPRKASRILKWFTDRNLLAKEPKGVYRAVGIAGTTPAPVSPKDTPEMQRMKELVDKLPKKGEPSPAPAIQPAGIPKQIEALRQIFERLPGPQIQPSGTRVPAERISPVERPEVPPAGVTTPERGAMAMPSPTMQPAKAPRFATFNESGAWKIMDTTTGKPVDFFTTSEEAAKRKAEQLNNQPIEGGKINDSADRERISGVSERGTGEQAGPDAGRSGYVPGTDVVGRNRGGGEAQLPGTGATAEQAGPRPAGENGPNGPTVQQNAPGTAGGPAGNVDDFQEFKNLFRKDQVKYQKTIEANPDTANLIRYSDSQVGGGDVYLRQEIADRYNRLSRQENGGLDFPTWRKAVVAGTTGVSPGMPTGQTVTRETRDGIATREPERPIVTLPGGEFRVGTGSKNGVETGPTFRTLKAAQDAAALPLAELWTAYYRQSTNAVGPTETIIRAKLANDQPLTEEETRFARSGNQPFTESAKEFNPDQAVKLVADNVDSIRPQDVYRLLAENPDHMEELATYLTRLRPEQNFVDSVLKARSELRQEAKKAVPVPEANSTNRVEYPISGEVAEASAWIPYSAADATKPTEKQLAYGDDGMKPVKYGDVTGFTNGKLADFGGPSPYQLLDAKPADAARLVEKSAVTKVDPVAVKLRPVGKLDYLVLSSPDGKTTVLIQKMFFDHFVKRYPGAEFLAGKKGYPLTVKHKEKVVGLVMPITDGEISGPVAKQFLGNAKPSGAVAPVKVTFDFSRAANAIKPPAKFPTIQPILVKNGVAYRTDILNWISEPTTVPDGTYDLLSGHLVLSEISPDDFPEIPKGRVIPAAVFAAAQGAMKPGKVQTGPTKETPNGAEHSAYVVPGGEWAIIDGGSQAVHVPSQRTINPPPGKVDNLAEAKLWLMKLSAIPEKWDGQGELPPEQFMSAVKSVQKDIAENGIKLALAEVEAMASLNPSKTRRPTKTSSAPAPSSDTKTVVKSKPAPEPITKVTPHEGDLIRFKTEGGGMEAEGQVTKIWPNGSIDVEPFGANNSIGIKPEQVLEITKAKKPGTTSSDKPKSSPTEINDFGEKIGGARKDLWRERNLSVADIDKMTDREMMKLVRKEEIFPVPDYQEMTNRFGAEVSGVIEAAKKLAEANGVVDPGKPIPLSEIAAGRMTHDQMTIAKQTNGNTFGAGMALLFKQIRDSIPQPFQGWTREKMKDYVHAVEIVRDGLATIKTMGDFDGLLKKIFGEDILTQGRYRPGLNRESRNYRFLQLLGNKFLRAVQVGRSDISQAAAKAVRTGFPAKQEMWQRKYEIHVDDNQEWFVTKRKTPYIVGKGFKSQADAVEWAKAHSTEKAKPRNPLAALIGEFEIVRQGEDYRKGKDISPQQFLETFGFRGGEFGNWTSQTDRQQALNHAFDGLMDLAGVLGVPAKALSLNGDLGIAFGARGSGGAMAGLAHYEPSKIVINLTKMKGAGSLAHEWAHAVDDYFGRQAGRGMAFMSEGEPKPGAKIRPEMVSAWKSVMERIMNTEATQEKTVAKYASEVARTKNHVNRWIEEIKRTIETAKSVEQAKNGWTPEMEKMAKRLLDGDVGTRSFKAGKTRLGGSDSYSNLDALDDLKKTETGRQIDPETRKALYWALFHAANANRNLDRAKTGDLTEMAPSDFLTKAKEFESKKGKKYWSTHLEMFARAFESWVLDRIQDKAGRSDYLVRMDKKTNPAVQDVYPQGSEREAIGKAFDEFVATLKTKETEMGNVALFSRETERVENWLNELGEKKQAARKEIHDRLIENAVNAPSDIVRGLGFTITTAGEFEKIIDKSVGSNVAGAYFKGNAYALIDRIQTPEQADRVFAHEVIGHHGFINAVGDQLPKIIDDLNREFEKTQDTAVGDLLAEMKNRYGDLGKDQAVLEAVGILSEKDLGSTSLWERIKFAVNRFLRKIGIARDFSVAEVKSILRGLKERMDAAKNDDASPVVWAEVKDPAPANNANLLFSADPSETPESQAVMKPATRGRGAEEETTPPTKIQDLVEKGKNLAKDTLLRLNSEKSREQPAFQHALEMDPLEAKSVEEWIKWLKIEIAMSDSEVENYQFERHLRDDNSIIHRNFRRVLDFIGKYLPEGEGEAAQDWAMKRVRRIAAPFLFKDNLQRLMFRIGERIYWDGDKIAPSPGFRMPSEDGFGYVYEEDNIPGQVVMEAFHALPQEYQDILTERAKFNEEYRRGYNQVFLPKRMVDVTAEILETSYKLGKKALPRHIQNMFAQNMAKLEKLSDEELQKADISRDDLRKIQNRVKEARALKDLPEDQLPRLKRGERWQMEQDLQHAYNAVPFIETDRGHYGYVHHMGFPGEVNPAGKKFLSKTEGGKAQHPWFEAVAASEKARKAGVGYVESLVMADIAQHQGLRKAEAINRWMRGIEEQYGIPKSIEIDGKMTDIRTQEQLDSVRPGYSMGNLVEGKFGKYAGQKIFLPDEVYERYKAALQDAPEDFALKGVKPLFDWFIEDVVDRVNLSLLYHPSKFMRDLFSAPIHVVEFLRDWSVRNPGEIGPMIKAVWEGVKAVASPAQWKRISKPSLGEYSESIAYRAHGDKRHWLTRAMDALGNKIGGNFPVGSLLGNLMGEIDMAGAGDIPVKRFFTRVGEILADHRKLTGQERERFIRRIRNEYAFETDDLTPALNWVRGKEPTPGSKMAGGVQRSLIPFFGYTFRLAKQLALDPFYRGIPALQERRWGDLAAEVTRPVFWGAVAYAIMKGFIPPGKDKDEEIAGALENRPSIAPEARTATRILVGKTPGKEGAEHYMSIKGFAHAAFASALLEAFQGKSKPGDLVKEVVTIHPVAKTALASVFNMTDPYNKEQPVINQLSSLAAMAAVPQLSRFGPDMAKVWSMVLGDSTIPDQKKMNFLQAALNQVGIPAGPIRLDSKGQPLKYDPWIEGIKMFGVNIKEIPFSTSKVEVEREAAALNDAITKLQKLNAWMNRQRPLIKGRQAPVLDEQAIRQMGLSRFGQSDVPATIDALKREVMDRARGLLQAKRNLEKEGVRLKIPPRGKKFLGKTGRLEEIMGRF